MTGKSEELMEKREKAMTEMLACLGVIAEGKFTGDVPERAWLASAYPGGIQAWSLDRNSQTPCIRKRKAYAKAGRATSALIEIRKHAG